MRVFTDLNQLPYFRNAVITIGSFDGVHAGHRRILEKVQRLAAERGGESVVITFDPHPRTVLKPDESFRLITTTNEKTRLLEASGVDNLVVAPFSEAFSKMSAQEYVEHFLIDKFHPACIVIGYDHRFGNNREGGIDFLKQYETKAGFSVVEIPAQEVDEIAVSSSKIRKALEAADIRLASRLLGHPFTFAGRVIEGDRIGRTIGFPTANLEITDRYKLMLPEGIYAVRVNTGPKRVGVQGQYGGMLYIGNRPTLAQAGRRVIEVNVLDFDGDLYGHEIAIEVVDFIRPDRKFDSMEALKAGIEADKIVIRDKLAMPESVQAQLRTAVVILNYNTRRHLEQYLPSVVAYSSGVRIIVADNGSPDDSIEFVRTHYPQIEILDLQRNYGFAEGYNQALKHVDADLYVLLNSDVEVTPGWLEPVLEKFRTDPDLAIANPKVLSWLNKHQFEYAGGAGGWIDNLGYPFCRGRIFGSLETDTGQFDDPRECFWASGAAFFIRAGLYHAFGGFDGEYFAHNEEIDLCWRVKRAGYSVWCIPQSVVYHLGGGTLDYESPRKIFLNFRNSLFTLLKNEPARRLLWVIPARFVLDGVAGLRFALQGRPRAVWAIVLAHGSLYRQFGAIMRKRKEMADRVAQNKIRPDMNTAGVFRGSIVWEHYIKQVKAFNKLPFGR
jgi:hypothetical protein